MPGFILLIVTSFFLYPGNEVLIQFPGTSIQYFEDSHSTLTANQVLDSNAFRPGAKEILNFGVTNSTYWFRLDIRNNSAADEVFLLLEQPLLDLVEVYKVSGSQAILLDIISKDQSFYTRKFPQINRVMSIPIRSGESGTVLLKVRSASTIILPLKIGFREQIFHFNFRKELWLSVYTGIMLATIIYNLFIFFSIRDRNYLLYVAYVLLITLTQTSLPGFAFKYFWPGFTFLAIHGPLIFSCLTGIAALEFIKEFLHAREFTPRLTMGIPLFIGLFITAILLSLTGFRVEGFLIMQTATAAASLFSLFISYRIYRLNYRPAKFFLLAWTILLVGAVVFVLKDFELVPYNNLTTSAVLISSALEALLLSFALADKINMLRKEKEESREQAMAAMAEIAKIGREQNIILETKVSERTLALKQSNEELNKAMQELKEAESQLVESEKMASLGQLTAGIAHEINNPTNFVTANVKPLRRDIEMIIRLFEQIEAVAVSAAGEEEKQARIRQLKDGLDYGYLKTEINELIRGIEEGSGRTAEIIKGLRNFSRLDEATLKKASINEGIDSTIVIINHMLEGQIEIVKNYGQLPLVECYPGKLNQVFLNILTNGLQAIKAKFGNRPGGVFTISTSVSGNIVRGIFKDNGIGMDKGTQDKIFEPFFTTKKVNEGIGLGMSIVYSIVRKHNGKITVMSTPGAGTEFHIQLPVTHFNGEPNI
ncbi:hypothetical protein EDD80_108138 [Anseongella ginsenosidimutans]|uniref:histidine kinase n=1 Tax=Anseongella ginsenosidimutans TaxID=496056 RepID=A0A4R3KQ35_9SPHI|nr:7TM diverse intracellular signaling domain-containing protein [Anseongella ginsenosidimutans]QEC53959.1 hypothetical protein FRZ59_17570 [Anseongella ginsenosidimutans]TCS86345.1 hypothetical protein EDD80_108138 [Anseongella ginsenosidimutans]